MGDYDYLGRLPPPGGSGDQALPDDPDTTPDIPDTDDAPPAPVTTQVPFAEGAVRQVTFHPNMPNPTDPEGPSGPAITIHTTPVAAPAQDASRQPAPGGAPAGTGASLNANGTWCPPVLFTVTGIGPGQADDKTRTAYSQTPGNQVPNGYAAVNPESFGVPRHNTNPAQRDAQGKALSQVQLYPDWSAAVPPNKYTPAIPRGLPSAGPYTAADALSPPTTDNRIDVYRYGSKKDAMASTRPDIPVRAWIPDNKVGVTCPIPRK